MTAIKLLSILIASICVFGFTGYGFTRFLAPSYARGVEAPLSLFVGIAVVVLFSHLLGYAGLNAATITYCILALSLVVNILAFLKKGRSRERTEVLPFIMAAPALFFALYPEVMLGYLTVVSPNGDPVGYSMYADHLMRNAFGTPPAPGYDAPANQFLLFYYYRSAFAYLIAAVNSVLGLKGYQTFSVITALLLFLNALAVYVVCRISGLSSRVCNLAVFLVSINGYLLLAFFQGFGPQLMSLGLISMSSVFTYHALDRMDLKSVALASLFTSTLITAYPDAIAFAALPGFLFLFWFILKKKSGTAALIATGFKIAALSLLVNPVGTVWGYKTVRMWLGAGIGTVGGNVPQMEKVGSAFGLRLSISMLDWVDGTALGFMAARIAVLDSIGMALIALICVFSVYFLYRNSREEDRFIALFSLGAFLLTSFFYLKGSTYVFYKSMILVLNFFVILFSAGVVYALSGRGAGLYGGAVYLAALAGVAAFVTLNLLNSAALSHMFYQRRIAIVADTIALGGAGAFLKKDDAVYIPPGVASHQLWEMYFLSPFARIHWGASSPEDGGMVHPYQSRAAKGDYLLMRRDGSRPFNSAVYERAFKNRSYSLLKEMEPIISVIDGASSPLFPMRLDGKRFEFSSSKGSVSLAGHDGLFKDAGLEDLRTLIIDYESEDGVELKGKSSGVSRPGRGRLFIPMEGPDARVVLTSHTAFTVNSVALSRESGEFREQHVADPSTVSIVSEEKNREVVSRIKLVSPIETGWSLSLDIYSATDHTHPNGHFGWGSVTLSEREKAYDAEFRFRPDSKTISVAANGSKRPVESWKGDIKNGDFVAFVVLRDAGRGAVLMEVPAFEFSVADGKTQTVAVKNSKNTFYRFALNDNELDLGSEASERFLVSGWSRGEASGGRDFAWGVGESSEIYLETERSDYKSLKMHISPNDEKGVETRTMAISLNGEPLGKVELKPGWDSYGLPMPGPALNGNGVRLTFSYEGRTGQERDAGARRVAFDSISFE